MSGTFCDPCKRGKPLPGCVTCANKRLRERAERYRQALIAIRDSPHQSYGMHQSASTHDHQYGIGVADGHRCAAKIAREALEES